MNVADKKMGKIINRTIIALVVIIVLSIIYASLTKRITYNEKSYSHPSAWKIRFANLEKVKITGKAKELMKPVIHANDTQIGNYAVAVYNPGDSVSYVFDVVNEGLYDATITSVVVPQPKCTGSGKNSKVDEINVCKHLNYILKYNDGSRVEIGDRLSKGERRKMKLTLTYDSNVLSSELARSNMTISNLDIVIIYSQVS